MMFRGASQKSMMNDQRQEVTIRNNIAFINRGRISEITGYISITREVSRDKMIEQIGNLITRMRLVEKKCTTFVTKHSIEDTFVVINEYTTKKEVQLYII